MTGGDAVYTWPANTPLLIDLDKPWPFSMFVEAADLPYTITVSRYEVRYFVIFGDGNPVFTITRSDTAPDQMTLVVTSLGGGSYVNVYGILP